MFQAFQDREVPSWVEFLGLNRESAVRFPFIISIPTIIGANVFGLLKYSNRINNTMIGPIIIGNLIAAFLGYIFIEILMRLARYNKFHIFAFYLLPLGIAIIVLTNLISSN